MNKNIFYLISIFIIVLFTSQVFALGVTPGRTSIDYTPGAKKTISFTVINSEHNDMNLEIRVQGDLNQSVLLGESKFAMSSSENEKKISFDVLMPEELSPGNHRADIIVVELPPKQIGGGQAIIGAALAVTTQVSINVPYPGKYIEGELKVTGDEKKKTISVSMINRGSEGIEKTSANINIYDLSGKNVKVLKTNEVSLAPNQEKEVTSDWEVDSPEGKYTAKAVLNFDGKKILFEKDFEIGEFALDLQQVFVKDFKLGGIAKFNMIVKNKWNEPINGVYTEMRVFDKELKEMADVKSATYDIPAELQTTMVYYWDTKDVSEGLYNASVILYYSGKKTQKDLKLDVGKEKIDVIGLEYVISTEDTLGSKRSNTLLYIIIGFLILFNLVWFFVLRKNLRVIISRQKGLNMHVYILYKKLFDTKETWTIKKLL